MKNLLLFRAAALLSILVLLSRADGGSGHFALAVVVHKSSTVDNLTSGALRKILAGEVTEWPDSTKVVLVQQTPASPVYRETLQLILHTDPNAYQRHLMQEEFQGKELPVIRTLSSDEMVVKFVGNVPGAIAVVSAATMSSQPPRTRMVRIDGKLPGEQGYPFE